MRAHVVVILSLRHVVVKQSLIVAHSFVKKISPTITVSVLKNY
jgi:hypothetical protein